MSFHVRQACFHSLPKRILTGLSDEIHIYSRFGVIICDASGACVPLCVDLFWIWKRQLLLRNHFGLEFRASHVDLRRVVCSSER